jgi:hypothetical protein
MNYDKLPEWDWKKNGLLWHEDVEEALGLKSTNPAAFAASERAQNIVAYREQEGKYQVSLARDVVKNVPRWAQDLWLACDPKKKPKERLAAIERFNELFRKIPFKVAVTLFCWLDGRGSRSDVIEALNSPTRALSTDPRTGALVVEDGKRGRKRDPATRQRVLLAARRCNQGVSQREMATELYPKLDQDQAYNGTRDLFLKNRYTIERARHFLKARTKSDRKPGC